MIKAVKIGDIVWTMSNQHPTPFFVARILPAAETLPKTIYLSEKRDGVFIQHRFEEELYHSFAELLLETWRPHAYSDECDQELKDVVSHAYNSGAGSFSVGQSEPAQQPDRDFTMLLAMLCHPRNAMHFKGDPDILRLAHDAMRRFRKNYPDHSDFFDQCDPQEPSVQIHGSFEHSDGTLRCTPEACAPTANARLSMEHVKKSFDKYRRHVKSVLISDPLFARDETADLPPVTFAKVVARATGALKKFSDVMGSVKNPCAEMLESTPPDMDANEFVECMRPEGRLLGRNCPDKETCQKCNVVETVFLPERKIRAWADGECVCNYIKSRSHYTREHNFVGSRENFKKALVANLGNDIQCDDSFPEITLTLSELSGEEFPPRENFLTKEEAKKMWDEASECDCGGPAGHLPGGSHCRKPL